MTGVGRLRVMRGRGVLQVGVGHCCGHWISQVLTRILFNSLLIRFGVCP